MQSEFLWWPKKIKGRWYWLRTVYFRLKIRWPRPDNMELGLITIYYLNSFEVLEDE